MDGKQWTKSKEGLRLKPYICTEGRTTIGYGRNLSDVGISQTEADFLFDADYSKAQQQLFTVFGAQVYKFRNDQYIALVDMVFNMGLGGFQKFQNMIIAIKAGDWKTAAEEALDSKWADQVGQRAIEDARMLLPDGD